MSWIPNGQIVTQLASSDPQPADEIYLTIDRNLQEQVQKTISRLPGRGGGAGTRYGPRAGHGLLA